VDHGGLNVSAYVEWLIDTGADVGVVQKQVGDLFMTKRTGVSAGPTTGSTGIQMATGITVSLSVEILGVAQVLSSSRAIGLKSDNHGSNLIGTDQLADISATIEWTAGNKTGRLFK
jgi:hypothetical protein